MERVPVEEQEWYQQNAIKAAPNLERSLSSEKMKNGITDRHEFQWEDQIQQSISCLMYEIKSNELSKNINLKIRTSKPINFF